VLFPGLAAAACPGGTRRAPEGGGAADRSASLAVAVGDAALSYGGLAAAASAHLAGLAARGIGPGDRVAVWTSPTPDAVVALVAHACAGLVSVPLNPASGERELAHVLGDARPRLVLGDPSHDPLARAAAEACVPLAAAGAAQAAGADDGRGAAAGGAAGSVLPGSRLPGSGQACTPLPMRDADDAPLLVLYTSGTTGPPKGAVITARNAATNLDALAAAWRWTERDTVVHALPLFHVHGLVVGLFGALRRGGALRWVPRFSPRAVAEALLAVRGDALLFAVPTMVHRLADAAETDALVRDGLRAARLCISGSAALPARDHARAAATAGVRFLERYGLTETLIVAAMRPEDPPAPGRVGRPLDGVEVRLVDDARQPIDARDDATVGEVAVRGPGVFAGYLGQPEATAAVCDADGWFYTGDLATRDASGSLRIVGRRSTDLIKSGGYKIGAGEIEAALLESPEIAECAVVGVPDDDLGERIVAFVVPRDAAAPPTLASLADRIATTLAPHKRPRELRLVSALPRNAMGKVQKRRLVGA
jgi:malonyl-CoA/methylmalonyl-CoA synthetase